MVLRGEALEGLIDGVAGINPTSGRTRSDPAGGHRSEVAGSAGREFRKVRSLQKGRGSCTDRQEALHVEKKKRAGPEEEAWERTRDANLELMKSLKTKGSIFQGGTGSHCGWGRAIKGVA